MLENSIACFLAQDYPANRRELIVLDDAGELENQTEDGWQIISIPRRGPLVSGFVMPAAFSPDGKSIAIGTGKSIKIWDISGL